MKPVAQPRASIQAWVAVSLSVIGMAFGAANWQRNQDLSDVNQQLDQQRREIHELREDVRELRRIMLARGQGVL